MPFINLLVRCLLVGIVLVRELQNLVASIEKLLTKHHKVLSLRPHPAIPHVETKPVDMNEIQIEMEKKFHKNQLIPRITQEFVTCAEFNFREHMVQNNILPAFGFDILVQMALHKRVNLPTLVGLMRKHFSGDLQATTDAIKQAVEADLMDWSPQLLMFIVKYEISTDVQHELDCYQYPMPMVVEPKTIKSNLDTGYLTGKGSIILKNNHHEDDVCLDHINAMNRIKLCIDLDVVAFVKNKWKNLDKPKEGETRQDYERRVRAFEKYDACSKDVMAHLEIAGNEFYLTHKYDKRGRVYSQGYHVNYQGNDYNKAVINFAQGEIANG